MRIIIFIVLIWINREERLKMTPWKSMFEKERVTIEHLKRETMLLRSRRLCGRLNDFELLKRIGKGAFGEVNFLEFSANFH